MRLSRGNVIAMVVCIGILALPFLYYPSHFNPYEYPKFIVFIVLAQLSFAFFVFGKLQKGKISSAYDSLSKIVVLFVFITLLSNVFGLNPQYSFLGSVFRYQGFITLISSVFVFFIIRNFAQQKELFEFFSRAVTITTLLLAGIALWHAVQIYVLQNSTIPLYQGRIIATLGNPNFLGGFMAMTLPFILLNKHPLVRVFGSIICLSVVGLSGSRSALLATGVVLILFTIRYVFASISNIKRIALSLIACVWFAFVSLQVSATLPYFHRTSIWDTRELLWKEALSAILKRPLLGYGQESFELVFPKNIHIKVDNTHNIFLEIALSSGFLGLTLFMAILFLSLKYSSPAVKFGIIAFLVSASFNPVSIAQIALFWTLAGFSNKR